MSSSESQLDKIAAAAAASKLNAAAPEFVMKASAAEFVPKSATVTAPAPVAQVPYNNPYAYTTVSYLYIVYHSFIQTTPLY